MSTLYAWGKGDQGQLGLGWKPVQTFYPMPVKGLSNISIAKISCGALHTVALGENGRLYEWGSYTTLKYYMEETKLI